MEDNKSKIGLLTKLIVLVTVLWILSAVLILFGLDNWSDRGTFGDLFGAVNALFSGLAFAGLLYTIILQKQELELQRKEIIKSSKVQQRSERALSEQVVQMKLTARLSALKTLIDYNNIQIANQNNSEELILKARERGGKRYAKLTL